MKSKKILIISFAYPPQPTIGARRISKISKELLNAGWTPIVVTAKNPKQKFFSETEIPNKLINYVEWPDIYRIFYKLENNKLFNLVLKVLKKIIPFTTADLPEIRLRWWINKAVKKSLLIIEQNEIDVIYSSFGPPASVRVASKLNKITNIPWIVEYRDLWTGNPYIKRNLLNNKFNAYFEKKLIANSSALITVSKPLKEELIKLHKKDVYEIYNGFDKLDLRINKANKNEFVISYTGTLYKGVRDPENLFKAISILKKENYEHINLIKIKFYGPNIPKILKPLIKKYNLNEIVHVSETISHKEVIRVQKNSNILLLLGRNSPSDAGVLTGKFFEYMERQKTILAITYPFGSVANILNKTGLGLVLVNEEKIAEFLKEKISLFKLGDSHLGININDEALQKFSRKNQTLRLTKIIDEIIS